MEQIRGAYPNYTEDQLSALKENEFVNWLKFYVSDNEVFSDSESEKGEFNEDSVSSEYSSNSD
ncbi:hypothetical protein HID58_093050 [Brassica napus]|uniref:Uncharacterized protein n=1 Tax=Brassica napus TaxID=3708 RepID=A0ABQ7XCJ4_BRANA|nr:hypothetical protein HID58_091568 [Brassica napus]KAH0851401.1 hypothetical protein HID58_091050 [Brassica napus]KAH0853469.1 hypothetical protein HID58_093160 [Brassica napus]KAH0853591.1 hypothetical protein HID58_093063 [Brassica napus]KAH0853601.1 hypothetical protein HID58_093050 [Brassica napus]